MHEHQGRKEHEHSQVGGSVELPGTVPVNYRRKERRDIGYRRHAEQQPGDSYVRKTEGDPKGVDGLRCERVEAPASALGPLAAHVLGRQGQSVRHTPKRVFPFRAMPQTAQKHHDTEVQVGS